MRTWCSRTRSFADRHWVTLDNPKHCDVNWILILPKPHLWDLRNERRQPVLLRNLWRCARSQRISFHCRASNTMKTTASHRQKARSSLISWNSDPRGRRREPSYTAIVSCTELV